VNKLYLKEATRDYVQYLYQPEGDGGFGEIRIKVGADDADYISKASEDPQGRYAHKAIKAIRECISEKNLPFEFTQAWY